MSNYTASTVDTHERSITFIDMHSENGKKRMNKSM